MGIPGFASPQPRYTIARLAKNPYPYGIGATLRILAHDLNKVKAALSHRSAILERIKSADETETIKPKLAEENIWGEGVKIVRNCAPNRKPFTQAEKEEFVEKYQVGMSMGAIAREYGCSHVIVGRILRRMEVDVR